MQCGCNTVPYAESVLVICEGYGVRKRRLKHSLNEFDNGFKERNDSRRFPDVWDDRRRDE